LLNRPEQTLIGVQYANQLQWQPVNNGYVPHVVTNSGNWVYAGTGFKDGDSVSGIVGYEADRSYSQYPLPNAVSGTYTLLSHSPFFSADNTSDYANSSVYQTSSGAWVFSAGSHGWSYAVGRLRRKRRRPAHSTDDREHPRPVWGPTVTQASVAYESASSSIEHVEEDCEASVDGYRLSNRASRPGTSNSGDGATSIPHCGGWARRSLQRLRYIQ